MSRRIRRLLVLAALLSLSPFAARAAEPASPQETLTVFAASSFQEAFRAIGERFTAARGAQVRFSFAGSQELRTQLEQGAEADLFASADRRHAEALQAARVADAPRSFASNTLVIVVRKGNPEKVRDLADLPRLQHLVVGAREVPVGAYTEKLFALADAQSPGLAAKLNSRVSSRELNVRQVLAKVALGEAEAGLVYRTDALAMRDRVDAIELPASLQQPTEAVIAVIARSPRAETARAFIEFVLSAEGQALLRAQGFGPAGAP